MLQTVRASELRQMEKSKQTEIKYAVRIDSVFMIGHRLKQVLMDHDTARECDVRNAAVPSGVSTSLAMPACGLAGS
jgi:hypothetical protein